MKPEFPLVHQTGLVVFQNVLNQQSPYVRAADLEDLLRCAQMIYGKFESGARWSDFPMDNDTHQARVLLVEPRPPKLTPRDRLRHAVNRAVTNAVCRIPGASMAHQQLMSETIQAAFDEVGE